MFISSHLRDSNVQGRLVVIVVRVELSFASSFWSLWNDCYRFDDWQSSSSLRRRARTATTINLLTLDANFTFEFAARCCSLTLSIPHWKWKNEMKYTNSFKLIMQIRAVYDKNKKKKLEFAWIDEQREYSNAEIIAFWVRHWGDWKQLIGFIIDRR